MKKLLASLVFAAVVGCATSSFAGVLSLDGFSGLALQDSSAPPTPDAIVTPFTYSGTTVGGPTFNRPLAGTPPTALSGVGTAVPYDLVLFTVATAGPYTFQSTAAYDNFTFLYTGVFNPATPLAGALIGNDDNPTIGLSGFTYLLATGTQYSFVTTGFSNTSAGTFTNTINRAVPEPSTWAMMGAGLAGLVTVQRLRRRAA